VASRFSLAWKGQLLKVDDLGFWMTIVFCPAPDIFAAWPAVFSHEQFNQGDLPPVLPWPRRVGFRVGALASGSD